MVANKMRTSTARLPVSPVDVWLERRACLFHGLDGLCCLNAVIVWAVGCCRQ